MSVSARPRAREAHPASLPPVSPEMGDEDFRHLATFVEAHLGISMPVSKRTMVVSRLMRRLRVLGMSSYREYCAYLRRPDGALAELLPLSDLITTHKTDFFREPSHFDLLTRKVLPELERRGSPSPAVWSAGCSSGEEVYTIAMVLADRAECMGRRFTFSVRGTDVSAACIEKARRAVYQESEVQPVPEGYRKRFLRRSVDSSSPLVRVAPNLRATTHFACLNFMDRTWPTDKFEIVFCRNVLIYFSEARRLQILKRLCAHTKPHGFLFIGHSESLHGLDLPIEPFAKAIYQKV
jgi:chemotaxis protein methyltransferase CheR